MARARTLAAVAAAAVVVGRASACSNLLASRGATADGSTMVGYLADDIGLCECAARRNGVTHGARALT
jgi:hypothetical protein